MIELTSTESIYKCPACHSADTFVRGFELHSIYSLADCCCNDCHFEFLQTVPVSHCVNNSISIDRSNGKLIPGNSSDFWLIPVMEKARANSKAKDVNVRKIVFEKKKEVVVLNTLDYLYGHVLLKLYNYQHHIRNNPGLGLIVIVPKSFEWLVPAEASEAWIVDLSLGELAYEHPSLTMLLSEALGKFDRVYLSMAYSHPDFSTIDIKRMTGIAPFDLGHYKAQIPTFTFVLREDRWWLKSPASYWLYRLGRRFKGMRNFFYGIISSQQEALVRSTIQKIKNNIPEARFFITGLGDHKGFEQIATDTRARKVDTDKEIEWCRIYADSHAVIGFHGSNMLLPTAFAAGCIEILPDDRYGNILQDISVRYNDRRQAFFYRFVDQYASPASVASKAIAMIRNYESFTNDMVRNLYSDKNSKEQIEIISQ